MQARRISILGSTGSIGRNTLDVIRHFQREHAYEIVALTGQDNIPLLAAQAREFGAQIAVTANEARYSELKAALAGSGIIAGAGPDALMEAAGRPCDWIMAGIVGIAGLAPTLAAARAGAAIALANKECLVCAGDIFLAECAAAGALVIPVDSEHNAIFQLWEDDQRHAIEKIILTASGGPFRQWSLERMAAVTPQMASVHPNWNMGAKISIDSATMFNKALEMIEARHLFALPPEAIEIIIHPQSIIHSMVCYGDGSTLAHLGIPDMRTAIGYALAWPERRNVPVPRLDLAAIARLDFEKPDPRRFPAIALAREAIERGGNAGVVLNAAKECAVDAFIAGRIGFLDMAMMVEKGLRRFADSASPATLEEIYEIDAAVREFTSTIMRAA